VKSASTVDVFGAGLIVRRYVLVIAPVAVSPRSLTVAFRLSVRDAVSVKVRESVSVEDLVMGSLSVRVSVSPLIVALRWSVCDVDFDCCSLFDPVCDGPNVGEAVTVGDGGKLRVGVATSELDTVTEAERNSVFPERDNVFVLVLETLADSLAVLVAVASPCDCDSVRLWLPDGVADSAPDADGDAANDHVNVESRDWVRDIFFGVKEKLSEG
jgi:hypothetical protein